MSTTKRKVKNSNNENECPSQRKRLKTNHWKLMVNEDGSDEEVQEMNFGILDSDESTIYSSTHSQVISSDENLNEQTPCMTAPVRIHQQIQDECGNLENTLDLENSNDSHDPDLNAKLKKEFKNPRNTSSNIEIYNDNKSIKFTGNGSKKFNANLNKGRSPLATVSCNNNIKNIKQKKAPPSVLTTAPIGVASTSNTTIAASTSKSAYCEEEQLQKNEQQATIKSSYAIDENFFLYRNRDMTKNSGKDPFKKLSDEMILQIFKWLPKKTLIRCSFVCRRFNQLSQDESLWTRLDLGGKSLRSGALGQILSHRVIILRLAQTELAHPVFNPELLEYYPDFETKLQFLDLSMAIITKPSLKMLISKCRNLKKLSLEHVPINDQICNEIAKNTHLEALNLAMCEGIEYWSLKHLMKELQQLHSLNISWTFLSMESVSALVNNITPNLLRLNVAGCRKNIFDSHVVILTNRCPNLLELDLSDCTGLTLNVVNTVCHCRDLEYLSLSRCYGISASSYIELSNLPSLAYLDVFGILSDAALLTLENTFPAIGINKFIHSSVARPTVGTRRTSIWGLRTRD